MQDLVFLLYELPAPLGKRSNRITSDIHLDPSEKSQGRSQDRYLVYKNIVMKKREPCTFYTPGASVPVLKNNKIANRAVKQVVNNFTYDV